MSLFDDFADFLNREENERQQTENGKTKKLLEDRKAYDRLMRAVFTEVREYYQTILRPRRDLFLVFKKDTETEKDREQYFLYRINVIAQDSVPLGLDLRYATTPYLVPEKITQDDWHSNVAFQMSIFLRPAASGYVLVFTGRVWGEIESATPISSEISLVSAKKRRLPYTDFLIETKTPGDNEFVEHVEKILTAATPNILDHRSIVWGTS